ncbi:MAG: GC-type dockerin domain-anchored protein [Phycisphaerales bacterium]
MSEPQPMHVPTTTRRPITPARFVAMLACFASLAAAPALAQLRVATWNLTNFDGVDAGRNAALRTALFDEFEGRSLRPDILVLQEVTGEVAASRLPAILNADPRGGQDWALAEFIDGPNTDHALVYRTSRASVREVRVAVAGGGPPLPPRNTMRYDMAIAGYDTPVLTLYSTHMKAGTSGSDRDRRLAEAAAIRNDAQRLPDGTHIMLLGDFNMQTSSEDAYQELIESQANDQGRLFDPIASPGSWNNSSLFRFLHTQDPVTAMDDRFDLILINDDLFDGDGVEYMGDVSRAFSRTTFDDANHSYRTWGNDGRTFDGPIATNNLMVGPTIAEALKDAPGGTLGHLPVFLDLLVPARIGTLASLNFGEVDLGDQVVLNLPVGNLGSTSLWTALGIQPLRFAVVAPAPFEAPLEQFVVPAGGGTEFVPVTLNATTAGALDLELRVVSNDPDRPEAIVRLTATVVGGCRADLDGDGSLTIFDFLVFQNLFVGGDPLADFDSDGELTLFDFLAFQNEFDAGC